MKETKKQGRKKNMEIVKCPECNSDLNIIVNGLGFKTGEKVCNNKSCRFYGIIRIIGDKE